MDGQAVVASERQAGRASALWPSSWLLGSDSTLHREWPELAWDGPRWISPMGYDLVVCGLDQRAGEPVCPGHPLGSVVAGPSRKSGLWYDGAEGLGVDASWDAELDGVWLLREAPGRNGTPQAYYLDRLDAPALRADVPDDPIYLAPAAEWLWAGILGLTPDDALIAVGASVGEGMDGLTAIVDTVARTVTYHRGRFAGFVPASSFHAVR
jgi:hypothetical protein